MAYKSIMNEIKAMEEENRKKRASSSAAPTVSVSSTPASSSANTKTGLQTISKPTPAASSVAKNAVVKAATKAATRAAVNTAADRIRNSVTNKRATQNAAKRIRRIGEIGSVEREAQDTWLNNYITKKQFGPNTYTLTQLNNTIYDELTPIELAQLDQVLRTEGRAAASDYLDTLFADLNTRKAQTILDNTDFDGLTKKEYIEKYGTDEGYNRLEEWGQMGKAAALGLKSGVQRFRTGLRQLGKEGAISTSWQEQAFNEARQDMGGFAGTLADISNSVGFMLIPVAGSLVLGVGGLGAAGARAIQGLSASMFGAAAGGSTYNDVLTSDPTINKQDARLYSMVNGTLEGALQYALGGVYGLSRGATTRLLSKTPMAKTAMAKIANVSEAVAKTPAVKALFKSLQTGGKYAAASTNEAIEEWLQAVADPVARNVFLDENNEFKPFSEDKLYAAFLGALGSAVTNAGAGATQRLGQKALGQQETQVEQEEQPVEGTRKLLPPGRKADFYAAQNGWTAPQEWEYSGLALPGPEVEQQQTEVVEEEENEPIFYNNNTDTFSHLPLSEDRMLPDPNEPKTPEAQKAFNAWLNNIPDELSQVLLSNDARPSRAAVIDALYRLDGGNILYADANGAVMRGQSSIQQLPEGRDVFDETGKYHTGNLPSEEIDPPVYRAKYDKQRLFKDEFGRRIDYSKSSWFSTLPVQVHDILRSGKSTMSNNEVRQLLEALYETETGINLQDEIYNEQNSVRRTDLGWNGRTDINPGREVQYRARKPDAPPPSVPPEFAREYPYAREVFLGARPSYANQNVPSDEAEGPTNEVEEPPAPVRERAARQGREQEFVDAAQQKTNALYRQIERLKREKARTAATTAAGTAANMATTKAAGAPVPEGNGETRTSKIKDTMEQAVNAGVLNDEAAAAAAEANYDYDTVTWEQSTKAAADYIKKVGGLKNAYDRLVANDNNRGFTSTDNEVARLIMQQGNLTKEEYTNLVSVFRYKSSDLGRALNLLKLFSKKTPEGLLLYAERQIENVNSDTGSNIEFNEQEREDILALGSLIADFDNLSTNAEQRQKEIDAIIAKASSETQKNIRTVLEKAKPGEEADWLTLLAEKAVADKVPSTLLEKFKAMQRINLLLNFKTQFRNFGGNFLHAIAETASQTIATPLDKLLAKRTGQRSVALPDFQAFAYGFAQGARNANLMRKTGTSSLDGNRYMDDPNIRATTPFKEVEIAPNKNIVVQLFGRGTNIAKRAYNWIDSNTSYLLNLGDSVWRGGMEESNRAGLHRVSPEMDQALINEIAEEAGRRVTFQNDSAIGTGLLKIRRLPGDAIRAHNEKANGKKNSAAATAADLVMQTVVPFAKTPANLLTQVLNYSPAGFGRGIWKAVKVAYKGENATLAEQREAVDAVGRGIVGSGLLGLGVALARLGLASGAADDDWDKAEFDKEFGKLPNAIKIGNYWIDFSQLAPIPVAINLGASVYNETQKAGFSEKKGLALTTAILKEIFTAPINDVTGDSLFQGIYDFVKNTSNDGITSAIGQAVGDMTTQLILFGSFLRSFVTAFDDYKRETSAETGAQKRVNQIKNQIPGLSSKLPVKYDTLGRPVSRTPAENKVGQRLYGLFSPFATSADQTDDPLYQELSDLYKETGDVNIFPRRASSKITVEGQDVPIVGQDRSDFQKVEGQTARDLLYSLIESNAWKTADDSTRTKLVSDAGKVGSEVAKEKLLNNKSIPYEREGVAKAIKELSSSSIPVDERIPPVDTLIIAASHNRHYDNGEGGGGAVGKDIMALKGLNAKQKQILAEKYANKTVAEGIKYCQSNNFGSAKSDAVMDVIIDSGKNKDAPEYNESSAAMRALYKNKTLTEDEKRSVAENLYGKKGTNFKSYENAVLSSLPEKPQRGWAYYYKDHGWSIDQYERYYRLMVKASTKVEKKNIVKNLFMTEYGVDEGKAAKWADSFYIYTETKQY